VSYGVAAELKVCSCSPLGLAGETADHVAVSATSLGSAAIAPRTRRWCYLRRSAAHRVRPCCTRKRKCGHELRHLAEAAKQVGGEVIGCEVGSGSQQSRAAPTRRIRSRSCNAGNETSPISVTRVRRRRPARHLAGRSPRRARHFPERGCSRHPAERADVSRPFMAVDDAVDLPRLDSGSAWGKPVLLGVEESVSIAAR